MERGGVKLTFLICGPPKSGTTSLYEYMKEHPDVAMSLGKEPKFFFKKYDKGVEWYYQKYFSHYNGETAVGEASAENINRRKVPKRLKKHVPNAKLIFTLRDPVERLWSHYQHAVNVGYFHPKRKFSEIIRNEKNEWANWQKSIGMYLEHLKRYEKYFERSQIKIITFREFANDTEKSVKEIFNFIGVNPEIKVETGKKHNERDSFLANPQLYRVLYRAWSPVKSVLSKEVMDRLFSVRSAVRGFLFRSEEKPEMPPKARTYLSEVYETPNARLQKWLGRDLSHWT